MEGIGVAYAIRVLSPEPFAPVTRLITKICGVANHTFPFLDMETTVYIDQPNKKRENYTRYEPGPSTSTTPALFWPGLFGVMLGGALVGHGSVIGGGAAMILGAALALWAVKVSK